MTHQGKTRRGFTQINKHVVICPPCGESTLKGGKGVVNKETLLDNPPSALRATFPTQGGKSTTHGFTLIELLVVVLIIGILAAVALPQYQVAVKKAQLMKYAPIVRALNEAEQVYFLANGEYTTDLTALDVEIPTLGCIYTHGSSSGFYTCGTERYGIWGDVSNAQAGDDTIRYLQFLQITRSTM